QHARDRRPQAPRGAARDLHHGRHRHRGALATRAQTDREAVDRRPMNNREIVEATDRTQVGVYARYPVAFVRGRGARLWDADGKQYLDFFPGLAVNNLGHGHPRILDAIRSQSEKLLHASNVYYNEPSARLGTLLTENSFADRVFFCNSGAEA